MDVKSFVRRNPYFDDSDIPQILKCNGLIDSSYAESPDPFEQNSVRLVFDPAVFESSDQLVIEPLHTPKCKNACAWPKKCFCTTLMITLISLVGFVTVAGFIMLIKVSLQINEENSFLRLVPLNTSLDNTTTLQAYSTDAALSSS